MLVNAFQGVGSTAADRSCCSSKDRNSANVEAGQISPLFWKGVGCFNLPSVRMPSASSSLPVCVSPWSSDPCASPETSHNLCYRGRSQQKQSPTSPPPCDCLPDDLPVTRVRSVKVQNPSIGSIYHKDETAVIEAGIGLNILPERDLISSPMPQDVRHHDRRQQKPASASPSPVVCPPDELKATRSNQSVKVQKPSTESIRHEGGTVPEKLADIDCSRKLPAKDPNEPKDLENPNSSKLKQANIHAKKMQKCQCRVKEKNIEQNNVKPETKGQPMPGIQPLPGLQPLQMPPMKQNITPSPQPERAEPHRFCALRWPFFRLTDTKQQPEKLSDESCPCILAKQKEEEIVCMSKKKKSMSPKEPEKLAEGVTPVPQKLASTKTAKQKEEEIVCKNDKLMSPKQLESPKDLEGQKSSNKASKLFNIKNFISKMNESLNKQLGQQAPSKFKGKDLKSPKTGKQKEGKVTCKCEKKGEQQEGNIKSEGKKDKPMSSKAQTRCPPQLPPVILGLAPVETPEGNVYEVLGPSCKWIDTGEIKKLRSQLTRSTSGFTASKRRKIEQSQSEDRIKLDFGDVIRYFASMNPEHFQQLMQEELEHPLDAEQNKYEGKEGKKLKKIMEKEKKKIEKEKRKAEKKGKKGKVSKITTTSSPETLESSDASESPYPRGFKLSIPVKDCPTAFAGLDCK